MSSKLEGFGNVIVEALECGVPIVSTRCGGPIEILDNGCYGKLTPIGDEKIMAETIETSINEKYDSSLSYKRSKKFLIDRISKEYLEYFFKNQ